MPCITRYEHYVPLQMSEHVCTDYLQNGTTVQNDNPDAETRVVDKGCGAYGSRKQLPTALRN